MDPRDGEWRQGTRCIGNVRHFNTGSMNNSWHCSLPITEHIPGIVKMRIAACLVVPRAFFIGVVVLQRTAAYVSMTVGNQRGKMRNAQVYKDCLNDTH